jgi:ribA/ribD-fused uncharacterized protein
MRSEHTDADHRSYKKSESAVFKKTTEKWGGLSNMAGGFPIFVNGYFIRSSEALYQACRFPLHPEVQEKIISQSSPMTAKMVGKPFREHTRNDWNDKRVTIMKWCLRVKLVQNFDSFSNLLKETGEYFIVENSNKDAFWGAKPIDLDTFTGVNALGRLLMELRQIVVSLDNDKIEIVSPPDLEDFLLFGEKIGDVRSTDVKPIDGPQNSLFDTQ